MIYNILSKFGIRIEGKLAGAGTQETFITGSWNKMASKNHARSRSIKARPAEKNSVTEPQ